MKLSISNIGWPKEENARFLKLIKEWGADGVEVAPSLIWNSPLEATKTQRSVYQKFIADHGLEMPAMHALFFGKPELNILGDSKTQEITRAYLRGLCELAADLGIKYLIYGSPGSRNLKGLSVEDGFKRAADFFMPAAEFAKQLNVCICVEPLAANETDFINTANDGYKLVNMVNSPGLSLHVDAKSILAEGQDYINILEPVAHEMKHFHINDTELVEINLTKTIRHKEIATALNKVNYQGYVSIEMRKMPDYYNAVKNSLEFSRSLYIN